MKRTILLALALSAAASQSLADGVHEDWESFQRDGRCWASTAPESSTGAIPGRSGPYLAIQNYPGDGVRGSVSVVAGYDGAGDGDVSIEVDGEEFDALAYGNAAFTASGKPEAKLLSAMRRGRKLVAKWTSASGETATDTYSLMGFTAAKSAIDAACR